MGLMGVTVLGRLRGSRGWWQAGRKMFQERGPPPLENTSCWGV